MTPLKKTALTALVVLASSWQPASAKQNDPADVAAIHAVVEQFRMAIIHKDKPSFMRLFFSDKPEEVTWQWVVDDAAMARIRKTKPDARKARHVAGSNYLSFIDGETRPGAKAGEEKFRDVKIDTDGEVASVNFDYSYLEDGRETNWGREMWQLVRSDDGWKIISVIYSVRDPVRK